MTKQRARSENYNWYSDWHRKRCASKSYMMDFDAVEYRIDNGNIRVTALFEIKSDKAQPDEHKLEILRTAARAIGCGAFYVKYYAGKDSFKLDYLSSDTKFSIYDLLANQLIIEKVSENVYRRWIDNL